MKYFYIFLLLNFQNLYAQKDSLYNNLDTAIYYSVSINRQGDDIKINGQQSDFETYEFYARGFEAVRYCCPCVLKIYNRDGILFSEGAHCQDTKVGWYKEYYPNGNLKISGQYTENHSGIWVPLGKNYRSAKDGTWYHYSFNGDTSWIEIWNKGEFIKQIPEQQTLEIWDVEVSLNGRLVKNIEIPIDSICFFKFIPRFKNSNQETDLSISVSLTAIGFKEINNLYNLDEFNQTNFKEIVTNHGIEAGTNITFRLSIKYNETWLKSEWIKVKGYS